MFFLIVINLNFVEQQLCAVIIHKQWLSITHTSNFNIGAYVYHFGISDTSHKNLIIIQIIRFFLMYKVQLLLIPRNINFWYRYLFFLQTNSVQCILMKRRIYLFDWSWGHLYLYASKFWNAKTWSNRLLFVSASCQKDKSIEV